VIRYNISVSFNYTVSDKWATVDIGEDVDG
jgi:hypothetical protein